MNVLWRLVSRFLECLEYAREQARKTREMQESGPWLGDGDTPRDYRPEEA
jgi:hypothetical protein